MINTSAVDVSIHATSDPSTSPAVPAGRAGKKNASNTTITSNKNGKIDFFVSMLLIFDLNFMFKCNNNTIINAKVYKYFIKSTFLLKKIKY